MSSLILSGPPLQVITSSPEMRYRTMLKIMEHSLKSSPMDFLRCIRILIYCFNIKREHTATQKQTNKQTKPGDSNA